LQESLACSSSWESYTFALRLGFVQQAGDNQFVSYFKSQVGIVEIRGDDKVFMLCHGIGITARLHALQVRLLV
jgi:hypothetical protein